MKCVTTTCDKCGSLILEGGSVLEIAAGELRRRRGPQTFDFCPRCSDSYLDWLASPLDALGGLEPTEAVEPATVPA